MPPAKSKKRAAEATPEPEEPPAPKAPKTTEPYSFHTPKTLSPEELSEISPALKAETDFTEAMKSKLSFTVDAGQKKVTLGGFDNSFRFAGNVQLYGPDGEGMYPNLKDLKGIVSISEAGYKLFVDFIANGFAKNSAAIAKLFAPGPEKNDFTKDPEAWARRAIKEGTINLPVKRTEKYNDDGSIDRVNISLTAKAKVTRKGGSESAEDDAALAGRLFGPDVAEHVRAEQAGGKKFYLPDITDALGARIDPERLFTSGRARFTGVLDVAIVSLFVIEAKSQRVPNFSSVTMLNSITGIRIIDSGASAAPVMTDEDRIKLAALL